MNRSHPVIAGMAKGKWDVRVENENNKKLKKEASLLLAKANTFVALSYILKN